MPRPASEHRLLLIRHALGHDGGVTRFLSLAETLRRRGGEATIVAGEGPLEARAAEAGTLRRVDWSVGSRLETYDLLLREARHHTAVLVGCLPQTLPLVPGLARETRLHLCVHSTPPALADAFTRFGSFPVLGSVLMALHSSGRVLLSAASEAEAREHEELLGLPAGVLSAFPNGVAVGAPARPSAGPIRSVALVSRLSRQKLAHVAAAAELVAAGRAAGREVRLDVYGAGPAQEKAVGLIESRLPGPAWRLRGAVDDPREAMLRADVVVGGGRAALEALVLGRRVATARATLDAGGGLGEPVGPETLDEHVRDNFRWSARPPVPPGEVWRTLESQSETSVSLVQERVRRELSDEAMLDRELALLEQLDGRPESLDALFSVASAYAATLGGALVEEHRGRLSAEARLRRIGERAARGRRHGT